MAKIGGYKDLIAWQKAMDLVVAVYRFTATFPREERFGLTAQARGAVVSIPSNIAEGYGRTGKADYMHFLDIAIGSANELETQLLAADRLGFGKKSEGEAVVTRTVEVQRIIGGLRAGLARTPAKRVARKGQPPPPSP